MDKNEVYPIIIHHPGVFYPTLGLTPHSLPLPRPLILFLLLLLLSFSLTLTDAPDSPLPASSYPSLPLRRTGKFCSCFLVICAGSAFL